VQIWAFHDSTWAPQHDIERVAGSNNLQILAADVTGDGVPDFIFSGPGANRPLGQVVSSASGVWRNVPFGTPDGDTLTENPTVQGTKLISYIDNCVPDCARGTLLPTLWTYDSEHGYFRAQ